MTGTKTGRLKPELKTKKARIIAIRAYEIMNMGR